MKAEALALHGGKPVRRRCLPYGHHAITEDDIAAVVQVLRSDWITQGPKVEEFEQAVADYCGVRCGVAFSSGTAALHAACAAVGLEPRDEVITSPLTFVATANAVVYCGARPVFADIRGDTLDIDPEEIRRRITPQTRAIIPVDFAGVPSDLDVIREIASRERLIVIEDAAHALGAEYKGQRIGGLCEMTVFSFHPVKHITTGEGGMVTTNNERLATQLRVFRNHGIGSDVRQRQAEGQWYYEMTMLGYNYRLTDIGSALGLSQLRRLCANLARRREIVARYSYAFKNLPGVLLPALGPDVAPAWHLYPIRLDLARFSVGRTEILCALRAEGVGANVHYIPVHLHPYYQKQFGYARGEYPAAEEAYHRLISLPMFQSMSDEDVEDVIHGVTKVLSYYAR